MLPNGEQTAEGNSFTIQKADRHMAGKESYSINWNDTYLYFHAYLGSASSISQFKIWTRFYELQAYIFVLQVMALDPQQRLSLMSKFNVSNP